MIGQHLYPHDPAMIGQRVHVYNANWPDFQIPRAGFIDGYAVDRGMFSVTVETSVADHRRGMAPRIYLARCLVAPSLEDRPVGVEVLAVLQSPAGLPQPATKPTLDTLNRGLSLASQTLPDYSDDEELTEDPEEPEKPTKPTKPKAGKKAKPRPQPEPEPSAKPSKRGKTGQAGIPVDQAEPLPPGFRSTKDGPEAPSFGVTTGPRVVQQDQNADDDGDDLADIMTPGGGVESTDPPRVDPSQESRTPIDQLMANPTGRLLKDLGEQAKLTLARTGTKELSFIREGEEKPIGRLVWISQRPGAKPGEASHGFAFKIRDRGGRCSITVAEHLRMPAEIQAAILKFAKAILAGVKAKPDDWASSHQNMISALSSK